MNNNFNPGDVVELKSGGPAMTVIEILNDGTVLCEWMDQHHIRHEHAFLASNINLYELPLPFSS